MPKTPRGYPRKTLPTNEHLPKAAPELWPGAGKSDEPLVQFFERVWAPYLQFGLSGKHIRRLDGELWKSLHRYIVRYAQPWPAHLELPGFRPKMLSIVDYLDQGRWRELSDNEIIDALMHRKRQRVREELNALHHRRAEIRELRSTVKKKHFSTSAAKRAGD